ncbi:hypothetical protein WUBG_01697 [Wuchereria bancrofti]|uniref:Secreted protein n=1 Tax=Wuchereria bancrofti TaxID=6293 RepID=J9FCQ6_WUCBA|nr:hypothetical protein WUBG_01697 [Wuchereria bancrofti]
MLPLVTIACILPTIPIFIFSLLIIGCSSKKAEPEIGGERGGKRTTSAGQGQPVTTPRSTPPTVPPPVVSAEKNAPKKETNTAGAVVGGGEEEDGGYESCPDMTPEQLAKIANESPAK